MFYTNHFLLCLLSLIGFLFSFLYYRKESIVANGLIDLICSGQNCMSKDIKLFGIFKLSFIGIYFFLSSFFYFLFIEAEGITLAYIIFSIFGIPVIFYSLFKQITDSLFCVLCNCIILTFCLFLIKLFWELKFIDLSIFNIKDIKTIFYFSLFFLLLFIIDIHLDEKNKFLKNESLNHRIWSEWNVVNRFIGKNNPNVLSDNNFFIFGNKEAENQIDLVLHKNCKYCKDALKSILELTNISFNFKLVIHISHSFSDFDKRNNLLLLNSIEKNIPVEETIEILEKWKNNQAVPYIVEFEFNDNPEYFRLEDQYFINNKFDYFPQIFIDGHLLPNFIDYEDLKISMCTMFD